MSQVPGTPCSCPVPACRRCTGTGLGRVYGWVIRVGNTGPGVLPSHRAEPSRQTVTAGNGPSPAGGGWSGSRLGDPFAYPYPGASELSPPPFGPGRSPCRGPPWGLTSPRAKGRDSSSFPVKLVKTAECHQKVSKRPVMLPIYQNGSQKSPLGILRKPFWPAFSHKELMGRFGPASDFIVKMTECRQCVHGREGVADTPTVDAASCLCRLLLICSARCRIDLFL